MIDRRHRVDERHRGTGAIRQRPGSLGSQLTQLAPYEAAFLKVRELTQALRDDGHDIRRLDLGGGLGIPYQRSNEAPPLPFDYGEVVHRTVGDLGCEIEIEPASSSGNYSMNCIVRSLNK